jgi:hypothetical protein
VSGFVDILAAEQTLESCDGFQGTAIPFGRRRDTS